MFQFILYFHLDVWMLLLHSQQWQCDCGILFGSDKRIANEIARRTLSACVYQYLEKPFYQFDGKIDSNREKPMAKAKANYRYIHWMNEKRTAREWDRKSMSFDGNHFAISMVVVVNEMFVIWFMLLFCLCVSVSLSVSRSPCFCCRFSMFCWCAGMPNKSINSYEYPQHVVYVVRKRLMS